MDIILSLFSVAVIIHVQPAFVNRINSNWLSKDNTNRLRGIMSISIVLHHISEHTSSGKLFPVMQHMGYLLVAVFFLLSGYGLMTQYRKKGQKYFDGFWKKKILFFIIILALDTIAYWLVDLLLGKADSIQEALVKLSNGTTIAGSAWYLVVQIVFYVFFWISFKFIRRDYAIVALTILTISLTFFLIYIDLPSYWFLSNFSFVLGVAASNYKEVIERILNKYYYLFFTAVFVLFALFSAIPLYLENSYTLCRIISAPVFSVLLILCLGKLNFKGGLWDYINMISLEIFLLHALVYEFLRSPMIYIKDDTLYTILVLIISILISIPAHAMNSKIKRALEK